MKNLILTLIITTALFSCSKENDVVPVVGTSGLFTFKFTSTVPFNGKVEYGKNVLNKTIQAVNTKEVTASVQLAVGESIIIKPQIADEITFTMIVDGVVTHTEVIKGTRTITQQRH